jgi:hypothetical protein
LCKPLIQLFYNSEAQKEIEQALQKFEKNQRKETIIEAALYPIIADLVSQLGNEVPVSVVWESIKGNIEGHWEERKPNEYHTSEYGILYRNTITKMICDKFGARSKHKEKGNVLIFNPHNITRAGKVYNTKTSIQTRLQQTEDDEGSEGIMKMPQKLENNNDKESPESDGNVNECSQGISKNTLILYKIQVRGKLAVL